ncbi:MAG: hypothetical protein AB1714_28940 [Acidobacteriota bacterium]
MTPEKPSVGQDPQDPVGPDFYIYSKNGYQLGIGGYVKFNGLYDFVPLENYRSFLTEEIPVGHANVKDNHLHFDINQTRLFFQALGGTPYGNMKIYTSNVISLIRTGYSGFGMPMDQSGVS